MTPRRLDTIHQDKDWYSDHRDATRRHLAGLPALFPLLRTSAAIAAALAIALNMATSDGFIAKPATLLTTHTMTKLPATHASTVSRICQSHRLGSLDTTAHLCRFVVRLAFLRITCAPCALSITGRSSRQVDAFVRRHRRIGDRPAADGHQRLLQPEEAVRQRRCSCAY